MRTLCAIFALATLALTAHAQARRPPSPHVHCVLECHDGTCRRVCRPVKLARTPARRPLAS